MPPLDLRVTAWHSIISPPSSSAGARAKAPSPQPPTGPVPFLRMSASAKPSTTDGAAASCIPRYTPPIIRPAGCSTVCNSGMQLRKSRNAKTAQLARSLDIALPHELTFEQNLELVRDFVREQFVSRGMIADIAIHAPGRKGDIRNVHVHILLTTRELTGAGFGAKARDWNRKEELQGWREAWADHANRILEREGFEERIDHRSLSDQGIDREPTTHVGPNAKEMEDRGNPSDRAQQNRDIKAANKMMDRLKKELAESQTRLIQLRRQRSGERMEANPKDRSRSRCHLGKGRTAPGPHAGAASGTAAARQTAGAIPAANPSTFRTGSAPPPPI